MCGRIVGKFLMLYFERNFILKVKLKFHEVDEAGELLIQQQKLYLVGFNCRENRELINLNFNDKGIISAKLIAGRLRAEGFMNGKLLYLTKMT